MIEETVHPIAKLDAPYGRELRLHDVLYGEDMQLLRLTIKEGRRITIVNLDAATVEELARLMSDWAARAKR